MANILVCDDERSMCEMLDIALRREGHKVETVQSGQAATGGWAAQQSEILRTMEKPSAEVNLAAARPVKILVDGLAQRASNGQ